MTELELEFKEANVKQKIQIQLIRRLSELYAHLTASFGIL